MGGKWIAFAIIVILGYTALPWIATRMFSFGVHRRGKDTGKVALTFDDGPHPTYTPLLLEVLKRNQVKATFFLLGSNVERYPDIVADIHREGHQIGIHNYFHISNWLLTPGMVAHGQVDATAKAIEQITGVRPTFYRPPWGILNLFDLWRLRLYRIIFWSRMPRDWSSKIGKTKLESRLMGKVGDGDIVLLHDSGETYGADSDAPEYMLRALPPLIEKLRRQGIRCVRVDEMVPDKPNFRVQGESEEAGDRSGRAMGRAKKLLLSVWMLWEHGFERMLKVEPVDEQNPLLKLRVRKYQGSQVLTLSDGETIRRGDQVAELHFDNEQLFSIADESHSPVQLAIKMIRGVELLLPKVRRMLADPKYRDVKGLYGISMIHRGAVRLGFTVIGLPHGLFAVSANVYLRLLLYAVHPEGKGRLQSKPELLQPKIIAMSRKELMNRYSA
ncbi:MAG: polysaccharide deacetylase family protein [Paenibacillaceae bacterium]|jgi:peptidoglycan/xylan/chitin deacetylase (PgdA/CDA1 family)|nr:polysaccharide deacetylase family protein [Paenibacillaceae bacterium]